MPAHWGIDPVGIQLLEHFQGCLGFHRIEENIPTGGDGTHGASDVPGNVALDRNLNGFGDQHHLPRCCELRHVPALKEDFIQVVDFQAVQEGNHRSPVPPQGILAQH